MNSLIYRLYSDEFYTYFDYRDFLKACEKKDNEWLNAFKRVRPDRFREYLGKAFHLFLKYGNYEIVDYIRSLDTMNEITIRTSDMIDWIVYQNDQVCFEYLYSNHLISLQPCMEMALRASLSQRKVMDILPFLSQYISDEPPEIYEDILFMISTVFLHASFRGVYPLVKYIHSSFQIPHEVYVQALNFSEQNQHIDVFHYLIGIDEDIDDRCTIL